MTLQKGNEAVFIKQDSWPRREGEPSLSFSTTVKSRLVSDWPIISKTFGLIRYCEMRFLQMRQKVHSSFTTALHACQIWSYKTRLFWSYLSIKNKWASEQFSEKKRSSFSRKKKMKIPWAKVKCGKSEAKMQISEHYRSNNEQQFELKVILGGRSTDSNVQAVFCLHHGSDSQNRLLIVPKGTDFLAIGHEWISGAELSCEVW